MSRTRKVVTAALLAAVLVAAKYALDALPNIEIVSLLLILYVLEFPALALPALYTYVLVYGLLNGFGVWWISQTYIWLPLMAAAHLLRKNTSLIIWALLCAAFGLMYGALYAVSYAVMNMSLSAGFAWWISGIPFDLMHCAGNFLTALILFKPLKFALEKCKSI